MPAQAGAREGAREGSAAAQRHGPGPTGVPDPEAVVPPHFFDATPELAAALRLDLAETVRALGAGWDAVATDAPSAAGGEVAWFVAGEPAQVMVGVGREYVRVACPREAVGRRPWVVTGPPRPETLVGMRPWWDPWLVGWLSRTVDEAQRRRRRSFGYCRYCRKLTTPEAMRGEACTACALRYARLAPAGAVADADAGRDAGPVTHG